MSVKDPATVANLASLRQGLALVERLDARQYTSTSRSCPGGSVGAHFRHCLDFYGSFLAGLDSGRIDYDSRERLESVETDPASAVERFRSVLSRLETISRLDRDRSILVRGDGSREDETGGSGSTVGRELQFLLSHTVHHFALIGFMLRESGLEIDATFGVAPSTLRHWKKTAAPAS